MRMTDYIKDKIVNMAKGLSLEEKLIVFETLKNDEALNAYLQNNIEDNIKEEFKGFLSTSHKDEYLVSKITGVVTCENYCKWYDLFYIENDGTVIGMSKKFDDFFNDVDYFDNSWNPKDLVDFIKKHNLKIGKMSYKAIVMMWVEQRPIDLENEPIPNSQLPNYEDLESVIIEDFGDYSNAFDIKYDKYTNMRYCNDDCYYDYLK